MQKLQTNEDPTGTNELTLLLLFETAMMVAWQQLCLIKAHITLTTSLNQLTRDGAVTEQYRAVVIRLQNKHFFGVN